MSETEAPQSHMSFWEHLQELRVRLFRIILAVVAAFGFTYGYPFGIPEFLFHHAPIAPMRFKLWAIAQQPFLEAMARQTHQPIASLQPWAFTSLTEPFFSLMRLSFWAAVFLAAPVVFYQLWAFIRPGLMPRERRMVIPFVFITSACFLLGVVFAYFKPSSFWGDILFQEAAQAGLRANLHIEDYLDLFLGTTVMTGVMFELPVLFYFLSRFRLVTAKWMLKYWRHATVIIVFVSAFMTPGDVVVTTIFFSAVLLALYFISVLVAWIAEPRKPKDVEIIP